MFLLILDDKTYQSIQMVSANPCARDSDLSRGAAPTFSAPLQHPYMLLRVKWKHVWQSSHVVCLGLMWASSCLFPHLLLSNKTGSIWVSVHPRLLHTQNKKSVWKSDIMMTAAAAVNTNTHVFPSLIHTQSVFSIFFNLKLDKKTITVQIRAGKQLIDCRTCWIKTTTTTT